MSAIRKRLATIALATCMTLLAFSFALALPSAALAWDNCPKGLVNDPYPGACNRYVDTNGDDICDLSQPKPTATKTATVAQTTTTTVKREETTTTVTAAATTTTSGEPPTGDCPLGPCAGCGACLGISVAVADVQDTGGAADAAAAGAVVLASYASSATTSTTTPPSGGTGDDGAAANAMVASGAAAGSSGAASGGFTLFTHYNVSPLAIAFFLVYAVSFLLHKTRRIRLATHRKVWNVLLAATFLITGIFGLILTIQLDYTLPFKIPFDLLFWHVEAGVVMTLISLFHLSWHYKYYRNLLRTCRAKAKVVRETERTRDIQERRLAWEARAAKRDGRRVQGGYAQIGRDGGESRRAAIRPRNEVEPEL